MSLGYIHWHVMLYSLTRDEVPVWTAGVGCSKLVTQGCVDGGGDGRSDHHPWWVQLQDLIVTGSHCNKSEIRQTGLNIEQYYYLCDQTDDTYHRTVLSNADELNSNCSLIKNYRIITECHQCIILQCGLQLNGWLWNVRAVNKNNVKFRLRHL